MNGHLSTSPASAATRSARLRRRFGIPLLAGWIAFWLVSVTALACNSVVVHAQAKLDSAAEQFFGHSPAEGESHQVPCHASAEAQAVLLPSATLFPGPGWHPTHVTAPTAFLPTRPAVESVRPGHGSRFLPPVPFHQRTARLRI